MTWTGLHITLAILGIVCFIIIAFVGSVLVVLKNSEVGGGLLIISVVVVIFMGSHVYHGITIPDDSDIDNITYSFDGKRPRNLKLMMLDSDKRQGVAYYNDGEDILHSSFYFTRMGNVLDVDDDDMRAYFNSSVKQAYFKVFDNGKRIIFYMKDEDNHSQAYKLPMKKIDDN